MLCGLSLFAAVLLGAASAAPCDIYNAAKTPCVAAHSTVRSLLDAYTDPMYQVKRASDSKTLDIKPLKAGGIADAASQDTFCQGTTCVISIIYDQSGKGNHLTSAPAGGAKNSPDDPSRADRLPVTIGMEKAYGVYIDAGNGYRNDNTTGIPIGDDAEAIYMVADGTHYNQYCCFDYGNAETDNKDDGAATMEAIYFGNSTQWGFGEGTGPWVMADLEDGLFGCAAGKQCTNTPSISATPYLVAMLKGRSGGTFALKQGSAQSGPLQTTYDGPRPTGYTVMKKQGAIVLGIGGDNSNWAVGSFYEGVIVSGDPTNEVDDKVQENIVAAAYGGESEEPAVYTFSSVGSASVSTP
ncbi:putative alpha-L-arabinofuranosidase B [Phytophthora rubi]|uniref:Putative alpha-L-arabinofuranosidase B n=2 Tax=Phytophthora TaxID=4783 RepID=A0A6A4F5Y5_9STRA|nr:putative alpha-L-arabinofuranosidase B [Phytophthora rubi]KAE9022321.1 putative alpha-L-arabinofuranosidase B [Phytophthora rubi]KAE9271852.1 putative alpha-L-arabinofuranosidase B [Phytophthora fragariae]KAE9334061.1 putative alpha-L-arabinofuranosidase B [Phytophthora rubi]